MSTAGVVHDSGQLPDDFLVARQPTMPFRRRVLMCPPTYFQVVDVKNPFMSGNIGAVRASDADRQWGDLKAAFESIGATVETITPVEGCEDMVFSANQTFPGLAPDGEKLCVLSHMRFPSRQREVPAYSQWFRDQGYRIVETGEPDWLFEGGGDAIWHPGRRLIWGGFGERTDSRIYTSLAALFDAPVLLLPLKSSRFYHLDTCFCPLDESSVLIYPPSIADEGLRLIERVFSRIVEVDKHDAMEVMACNATAFDGGCVVLQRGADTTNRRLRKLGFEVIEVETSEFLKSGGSVYCMKIEIF